LDVLVSCSLQYLSFIREVTRDLGRNGSNFDNYQNLHIAQMFFAAFDKAEKEGDRKKMKD